MSASAPVLPAYSSGCLSQVVSLFCAPARDRSIPAWAPGILDGAERAVLLVLDGLGWNQLQRHRDRMPTLSSFEGGSITTVAPSTTATALTSLTTGLTPGEHGLVGYRIDMGDTVMNVLRWGDERGDLRRRHPPEQVQPCPAFMGSRVPVISKAELEGSAFTAAHLNGARPMGWRSASSIAVNVAAALADGHHFVYAYYDGIDKIAHAEGFGPHYEAELAHADRIVADVLASIGSDVVLVVTADHGQVHVGDNTIVLPDEMTRHLDHQSGEGRFRWLHARAGRSTALHEEARRYDDVAWVVTKEQVLDEQWFGPRVSEPIRRRLGDVALVAREAVSFDEPLDSGAFDLICRHGSLTDEEMFVPLLARQGR